MHYSCTFVASRLVPLFVSSLNSFPIGTVLYLIDAFFFGSLNDNSVLYTMLQINKCPVLVKWFIVDPFPFLFPVIMLFGLILFSIITIELVFVT